MGIDLLVLALDGVMFDTEEAHLHASNAAFDSCGLRLRWSASQFREAARTWGATKAVSAVTEKIRDTVSNRDAEHLMQEKDRLFHEFVAELQPALHAGCAQLMNDALAGGCKLAVVTDMQAKTANALLEQAFGDAVNHRFAVVVSGAAYSAQPGNGPHDLAMRTVGVDAAQCVAIDAAAPGLRAAQRAGIWTIATTPYEKEMGSIAEADLWCPQLLELRELIAKRKAPRERAKRFVTFDMLRAMKRHQLNEVPVLRQRPQLRRVA